MYVFFVLFLCRDQVLLLQLPLYSNLQRAITVDDCDQEVESVTITRNVEIYSVAMEMDYNLYFCLTTALNLDTKTLKRE